MKTTTFNPPAIRSALASGSAADLQSTPDVDTPAEVDAGAPRESGTSAVSWAAILCGAAIAAAVSLLLVALGAGLGLASLSPWTAAGVSATTFTAITAIWFIVTQWVASGIGGYLTGRLRTKWVGVHTHEVFFRDTAHGFATWAVGTLVVAVSLSAGVASLAGGALGAAATGTVSGSGSTPENYDLDVMLRGYPDASQAQFRAEATGILAKDLASGQGLTGSDRSYLAAQLAAKAGIPQSEAEERVDGFVANSKAAMDKARKAAAAAALFAGISMLIGAFIACVAAALGGRLRDAQSVPSA
jgi:hypothetical protein